ncbi:hypothetical protein SLEP1_g29886 [Rubroshorea leprosula]|uniref:Uncharacterized protein n=1 Tax=Rubroshorea leprosula TaxID=152421 RepID=A0AAV5K751_9ROSI|nr:hypothetical protein SLEP1_g29886 [Rubroshorea leprosula]
MGEIRRGTQIEKNLTKQRRKRNPNRWSLVGQGVRRHGWVKEEKKSKSKEGRRLKRAKWREC